MLKGIDLSNNNGYSTAYDALVDEDVHFVWCKITEGKTYRDTEFETFYRLGSGKGKIMGAYHFARPDNNSPYEEAEWFYKNIKPYLSEGLMLALDWEKGIEFASNDWISQFMGRMQYLLGIGNIPIVYIAQSNYWKYREEIPKACGLWIASWDVSTEYVIKSIDRLVAFHQTGIVDGIDRDVFNGDLGQCKKYLIYDDVQEDEGSILNWDSYRNGFVDYLIGKDTYFTEGINIFMNGGNSYKAYVTHIETIESVSSIYQILTLKGMMPNGSDSNS